MHCNVEYAKQLHVDIFCWGSGAPTIWISKGPKQNLKGPSIETHHQFFILFFFLLLITFNFIYLFLFIYFSFFFLGGGGLKQNFTRAPLDFQGPIALTSSPGWRCPLKWRWVPPPIENIIKLWRTRKPVLWKNWNEWKMVFVFNLVVVYNSGGQTRHNDIFGILS